MSAVVTFCRLPLREQRTTLWVVVVAVVVEVLLRCWPLPRVVRALGVTWAPWPMPVPARGAEAPVAPSPTDLSPHDHRVVRCTRRVMRRWPFCEGSCLRQSLVLGYALRRHGPRLRIGVALPSAGFGAHAWVDVCGMSIGAAQGYHSLEWPSGSAA